MGLHLNASKCELIAHPNFSIADALLQSLHELMSVVPPFWVQLCFTALSWTNRGMVAVMIWPQQQRGCVTSDARMR